MTERSKAVFLSYASQDAEAARHICEALRAAGIEVWFDRSELRGGDAWDSAIRRQIKTCDLFIPVISVHTHAREEGYFRLEWKLAVDRSHLMAGTKAFLLPVAIDGTREDDERTPDRFREVQWTILPGGHTPPAFVERVSRLLSGSSSGVPIDVHPEVGGPSGTSSTPKQRPQERSGTSRNMQAGLWLIAAAAVIGLGYIAVEKVALSNHATNAARVATPAQSRIPAQSAISEKSIAVLPFVDMSEKKDQEYFSDGLSEELIDHLAHSADLKVIARTSSFQFKGKNEDARTIAGKLGVANLLEGSVRTSGHAVRITAQLIRASDGTHVWSQSYDRQLSDIFKVQDEIAATVVESLKATLSGVTADSAGREGNVVAYNLLLKGNFFYERSHTGDDERAIEQYQQALQLDPNYALAWAKLARVYIWQASTPEHLSSDMESKARAALQRALAINPNLAAAHRWLGRVYLNFRWDWTAAQSELERAVALDPNGPEGNNALRDLLVIKGFMTGQFEEGIQHETQTVGRNPLDTTELNAMGWLLYLGGHLAEAAAMQRRLLELDPAYQGAHAAAARTLLLLGKNAEALAEAQKETDEESRLSNLGLVYWAMGRRTDADIALSRLESQFANASAYDIGTLHAYRGEADAAMTWLERAYQQRDLYTIFLKVDPLLRNVRGNLHYQALLRKMKLAS